MLFAWSKKSYQHGTGIDVYAGLHNHEIFSM